MKVRLELWYSLLHQNKRDIKDVQKELFIDCFIFPDII